MRMIKMHRRKPVASVNLVELYICEYHAQISVRIQIYVLMSYLYRICAYMGT